MSGSVWWLALGAAVLIALLISAVRARKAGHEGLPAGTSVRITTHATQRMAERGITAAQIEQVLAHPTRVMADQIQHSVQLERDCGDRVLKVWVVAPWPARDAVVVKSTAWQYVSTVNVPKDRVGLVIGCKGRTAQAIRTETGAHLWVEATGTVHISAGDRSCVEHARERIAAIAA
jgi:polyribonucleotide nucleotidyltransferase